MKIKKVIIYGYGKWVDETFNLSDGLQIFSGKNEAGKSTLMSFIHSIFFGFPTRNSVLLRYEPVKSSKYGGKIIAEDSQLGEVSIERIHGKVTGDVTVTLEDGSTGSDSLLKKILKGMDRESYRSIFSFSLRDIENVHQLDKNKLSRYLLNIGAHSTDYYLKLVDEFKKDAYDLYRPSGRIPPLNKELSKIESHEKKLKRIEKNNESYIELVDQNKKQNHELEKIEKDLQKEEKKKKDLEELEKDLHLLEEIQKLKKEINQAKLPYLKEDGLYILKENKNRIAEIHKEIAEVHSIIKKIKNNIIKSEMIDEYEENKEEIKSLEETLPDKIEEIEKIKRLKQKIKKNKEKQEELKKSLKIEENDFNFIPFTKEDKNKINKMSKSHKKLVERVENKNQKAAILETKINQKNEKADYYEKLMWDSDYLSEVKYRIEEKPLVENKNPQNRKQFLLLSLVALFIVLLPFFIPAINRPIAIGVGLLIFILNTVYYRSKKQEELKHIERNSKSLNVLSKEYKNQQSIQLDWKNTLAEIDAIQKDYQETKEKIKKDRMLIKEINQNWRRILNNHHIPPMYSMELADTLVIKLENLHKLDLLLKELTSKKLTLTNKLDKDLTVLSKILPEQDKESTIVKINSFRQYLKEINELINLEQSKLSQITLNEEKERELLTEKEILDQEVKHLIQASGVETEEEFKSLYRRKKELDKKKSRVKFLIENTPNFDLDNKIPDREEIKSEKEKIDLRIEKLTKKSKKLLDERAKINLSIQNLEKDGRYSENLQIFENQKASIQNLVDEWISDKLAETIIQKTLNRVTEDRFKAIIEEINKYFSYLTDNNYRNILFKDEELFVQNDSGEVIEIKTLSRGTAEPLYIAIRLAYIVKVQDLIKLPIIMDDPFVNFDDERKENMYNLLHHLADHTQIIYFSFDSDIEKYFTDHEIHYLERG